MPSWCLWGLSRILLLESVVGNYSVPMFRNNQQMHTKCINSYQFIISLSCSYMFRQLCAIIRELVCTFWVTCQFGFLVDKILKYKEIKFSVSSDCIILLLLHVYMAEYTSKTLDKMHCTKIRILCICWLHRLTSLATLFVSETLFCGMENDRVN
jgi:hypothetical protein